MKEEKLVSTGLAALKFWANSDFWVRCSYKDMQYTYNVTWRRLRTTIVAVEKQ